MIGGQETTTLQICMVSVSKHSNFPGNSCKTFGCHDRRGRGNIFGSPSELPNDAIGAADVTVDRKRQALLVVDQVDFWETKDDRLAVTELKLRLNATADELLGRNAVKLFGQDTQKLNAASSSPGVATDSLELASFILVVTDIFRSGSRKTSEKYSTLELALGKQLVVQLR